MTCGSQRAILLGSGVALLLTAGAGAAWADPMDKAALRQELQMLENRLSQIEKQRRAEARRARRPAQAAAVEAGSRPRSWKLPGTNTSMRIGGFVQFDLIYDINHFSGDGFSSNGASAVSFPSTGSAAANRQGNFRLMVRRSRAYIRTWTPTDWGTLETRIEGDFFGTGGNQLISNSNAFRLRHAYGRLGPVLAGQTNSTFRFTEFEPRLWEDRGPAARGGPRQGIIQYTHSFGGGTTAIASIENPETGRAATSTAFTAPVVISGGGAEDRLPDFVLALKHKWSSGIFRIGGLLGQRGISDGAGVTDHTFMWGAKAGLLLKLSNKTLIGGHLLVGRGIGRYFRGQPAEVAITGTNGTNVAVRGVLAFGGQAWIQHQWTDTIQTNVAFGRIDGNVEEFIGKRLIPAGTLDLHWTIHANITYEPLDNFAFAFEWIMAKSQFHNALSSTAQRLQVSMRYSF